MEDINWCEFFQGIESNPTAIVRPITIRQFYQAKEHLNNCDVCYNRSERVLSKAPKVEIKGFTVN